jgi:hypothetical protein
MTTRLAPPLNRRRPLLEEPRGTAKWSSSHSSHRVLRAAEEFPSLVGSAPLGLITGGYLLHAPAIAVRIAEEDESDVIEVVSFTAWAKRTRVEHMELADLHPSLGELGLRSVYIRDDQVQALEGARHARDPLSQGDRAGGSGRSQLDEAHSLAHLVVGGRSPR